MNFFVDIDNSNYIVIHKTDCKSVNKFKKMFISEFYNTYEEVEKQASKKEIIYEFERKDCPYCGPSSK